MSVGDIAFWIIIMFCVSYTAADLLFKIIKRIQKKGEKADERS